MSLAKNGSPATGTITTGNSITLGSIAPVAGEIVFLWVATRTSSITVNSISGCNLTWSEVWTVTNTQGVMKLSCWKGVGASPTTDTPVVSLSTNSKPAAAVAQRFSGHDGSNPTPTMATNAGPAVDNDDMKHDITTQYDNSWAVAAGSHRLAAFTMPGGEVEIYNNLVAGSGGDECRLSVWYEAVATAGTATLGGDNDLASARDWCMGIHELKEAAATGIIFPVISGDVINAAIFGERIVR